MKRKSILTALLLIVMLFTLAFTASAADEYTCDGYTYREISDGVAITGTDETITGDIVIPSTLDDKTVMIIDSSCFSGRKDITSVVIPNTVNYIGNYAFIDCYNLKSVVLPEGLTSIPEYAFQFCSALEAIDIPQGVTSIGYGAFSYCYNLKEIILPEGIEVFNPGAIYNSGVDKLYIPASVKNISGNFSFTTGLYEVEVSPDNENYCSVDGVLYNKDMTRLINYPANKAGKTFVIPDTVTEIAPYAFEFTNFVEEITVPATITVITDSAFDKCMSLKKINLLGEITEIEADAFLWCSALESFDMPETVTKLGENCFSVCYNLKEINIPEGVTEIPDAAFNMCLKLEKITLPSTIETIGDMAFLYCLDLKEINLSEGLKHIGECCFMLNSIEELYIPSTLETWGESPFAASTNLKNVVINNENFAFDGQALFNKDMTELFAYCGGSEKEIYKIPDTVTKVDLMAFAGAENLKYINIPATVVEGELGIGGSYEFYEEVYPEGTTLADRYITYPVTVYGQAGSFAEEYVNAYDGEEVDDGVYFDLTFVDLATHTHEYNEKTENATCTADGLKTYTCNCSDTYTEVIKATGHSYTEAVIKNATCLENGEKLYTCLCGDSYTEEILAPGAHADADGDGKCDACGENLSEDEQESIFDKIAEFFQKIIDFLKNLFGMFG